MILVFTAGEGFTGAVTRFWTWGAAGHVAAEVGERRYLDATPSRGVAEHSDLAGRIVGRFRVDCEPDVDDRALAWARAQIGKPYDWWAIAGMPWRRDWGDPTRWFCSDLWAASYAAAGCPLVRAEALDRITPSDRAA